MPGFLSHSTEVVIHLLWVGIVGQLDVGYAVLDGVEAILLLLPPPCSYHGGLLGVKTP